MKIVFAAALGAALWASTGVALAGPVEDYVTLRTAEYLDLQCKALKYVEHSYLIAAQVQLLEQTGQWGGLQSGKLTQEQYNTWMDERNAEAKAMADAAGCTAAAEPYLVKAREQANALIAQGLLLALHFDGLPEGDPDRQLLGADQKQAAQAYDVFMQQVWGTNYSNFMGFQQQQARAALPFTPTLTYGDVDPYGFASAFRTDDELDQIYGAKSRGVRAMDLVQFEVLAETNGWRVLPEHLEGGWIIPTLTRADNPAERLVVVQGPSAYSLADYGGTYQQLLARAPDGSVKLMIFGEAVNKLGPTPGARFYIPSLPAPQGLTDWSWFNEPTYRDTAMVWDGAPMSGTCLGGPCFEFPPEVFDAIAHRGEQGAVELFISDGPSAQPAPITPGNYRSGRIEARHFFGLMGT